jgi:hypothetical protein
MLSQSRLTVTNIKALSVTSGMTNETRITRKVL